MLSRRLFIATCVAALACAPESKPKGHRSLTDEPLEFGWMLKDGTIQYFKITKVEYDGTHYKMNYNYHAGFLHVTLDGQKLEGTWNQDNGSGAVSLSLDPSMRQGIGYWDAGKGTPTYPAYLRSRRTFKKVE